MKLKSLVEYINHTPYNSNSNVVRSMAMKLQDNVKDFYTKRNITKVEDYLYTINFYDYDYSLAQRKFKEMYPIRLGGGSGVIKDNLMGRNYDWLYDNATEFIIRTAHSNGRFASIGIANGSSIVTLDMFDGYLHHVIVTAKNSKGHITKGSLGITLNEYYDEEGNGEGNE